MFRHLPLVSAAFAACIFCACSTPAPTPDPAPDTTLNDGAQELLARLVGEWVDATGEDSTIFHELWSRTAGQDMEGIGYVMLGNDTISIEHLRILHTDTGTFYSAEIPSQNHGKPVLFRMTSGNDSLVFENPQHDFPTRIVYRPEGNGWIAHVSGQVRGEMRALRFHLTPREKGTEGVR